MSSVFLPFNFNPESVSVTTGTTIAAGKYAYVTATVSGTGTFSINGSVAQNAKTSTITTQTSTEQKQNTTTGGLATSDAGTAGTKVDAFGYTAQEIYTSTTASYWVPAGTVLATSGDTKLVVSIFNIS